MSQETGYHKHSESFSPGVVACVLVVRRNHPSLIAFAALTLLTASCQNLVTPPDTTPLPYDPYVPPVRLVVERAVDINVAGDGSPAGLTVYGGALVFSAVDGDHGTQLWSYNGAAATRVTDINSPDGVQRRGAHAAVLPGQRWGHGSGALDAVSSIAPISANPWPQACRLLNIVDQRKGRY
ncbi:MAG: hypothetical protein NT005_15175 [Spirochaetes bacterium]|nr:hypothetical protein [Spirochaetota bacterium]